MNDDSNGKSELLDFIAKYFPGQKLAHLNPVEIKQDDVNNDQDLKDFLGKHLSEVKLEEDAVTRLVEKCQ